MQNEPGTTGSPSSTSNSPASNATSSGPPASILERRNRRRSNTLSGPHPAEVPLTDADQKLAALIGRINAQNAREGRTAAPQPLPVLILPALTLKPNPTTATATTTNPSPSSDKTPTQASFRQTGSSTPQSTDRNSLFVRRSHTRDGSISTTSFVLPPIEDQGDSGTPTEQHRILSPVGGAHQHFPVPSPIRDQTDSPQISPRFAASTNSLHLPLPSDASSTSPQDGLPPDACSLAAR